MSQVRSDIFDSQQFYKETKASSPINGGKSIPSSEESTILENGYVVNNEEAAYHEVWIEMERAKVIRYKDEHTTRISLIERLFALTTIWLLLTIILVVGVGKGDLKLSDGVLITILTTTTLEVLGYLTLVLLYLFNKDGAPISHLDIKSKNGKGPAE